jgi:hypothetical protein
VKVLRLEAEEVTVWLERKEGLGVNAVRYRDTSLIRRSLHP